MKRKQRRLQGYPYRHSIHKGIEWWDTYGDKTIPSVTGGTWHLLADDEVGMFRTEANDI
jgi:hypothetical protein